MQPDICASYTYQALPRSSFTAVLNVMRRVSLHRHNELAPELQQPQEMLALFMYRAAMIAK